MKDRARLTHLQFHRLVEWVRMNRDSIEKMRYGKTSTARDATKDLGFSVSPSSLETVSEALGDDAPKYANDNHATKSEKLTAIRTYGSRNRAAINLLARELADILDDPDLVAKIKRVYQGGSAD